MIYISRDAPIDNHILGLDLYSLGMWRDLVARGPICLARPVVRRQHPLKIFSNVYIRAAQLIVKNFACDLDSNTKRSYSWMTTIQLHIVSVSGAWEGSYSWMTMIQLHIVSVSGAWEAGFVAPHVDEAEGRPSSRFRCERGQTSLYEVRHKLLHWILFFLFFSNEYNIFKRLSN